MRDDFTIPNMGEAPANYDKGHINRVVRNVEMTFRTAKSKGPINATTITADDIIISGAETAGRLRVNNNTDISSLTQTDQPVQIGTYDAVNMMLDGNEIQVRLNGVADVLNLMILGGILRIGSVGGSHTMDGTTIAKLADVNSTVISGGSSANNGAHIELYGGAHATDANRAFYDANQHTFRNQAATLARLDVSSSGATFYTSTGIASCVIPGDSNGAIELGKTNGATSTPLIDFHTSATPTDYNVRLIASGTSSTNGSGQLDVWADGGLNLINGRLGFPAAQNPSTGANVLDDYEEGTWTPTLQFGGASTGITYSIRTADYVKIGQFVRVEFRIFLTNKGSSTGSARVTGLPFTCNSIYDAGVAAYATSMSGLTSTVTALSEASNTFISLFHWGAGGVGALAETNFTNNSDIIVTVCYRASA